MDLDKILEVAAADELLTDTFAIKIGAEAKNRFVALCAERRLSTGRVARELIRQFCEAAEA